MFSERLVMILEYDRGTLLLRGTKTAPSYFRYDNRVGAFRALAIYYQRVLRELRDVEDRVLDLVGPCNYESKDLNLRKYQHEAYANWTRHNKRGIVVLPTGAGKTRVAIYAIQRLSAPTLVVVPTLELMNQWARSVARYLGVNPSFYGGGKKEISCITIATYDSAYINIEKLGNRFLLMVFDEVHHLPSPGYRQIAELSASPYRLGLTATPEREDNLHTLLDFLVGPIVYRKTPRELSGKYLAEFDIKVIRVKLNEEDRKRYEMLYQRYKSLAEKAGIRISSLEDFQKLIMATGLSMEAREALVAWREAREIAMSTSKKIEVLADILSRHRHDRVLIFAESNDVVREISKRFLIPEISYKIDSEERRMILDAFKKGDIRAIVTSRVLEEGVDVPQANVGVILSGTGSKRQFIQRLGRILRPMYGKRAILYEIVTSGTVESRVSRKRRKGVDR